MSQVSIVSLFSWATISRLALWFAIACSGSSLSAQIFQPVGYNHDLATALETSLYFFSEPGDFIGQGQEWYSEPSTSTLGVNGSGTTFASFFGGGWSARFESEAGRDLEVGFYDQATRYPFNDASEPGLSVTGMGRGCNRNGGQFEILALAYDASGNISAFDVEFAQFCENETGVGTPALFGRIRVNAVPEPSSGIVLAFVALLAPAFRRKK